MTNNLIILLFVISCCFYSKLNLVTGQDDHNTSLKQIDSELTNGEDTNSNFETTTEDSLVTYDLHDKRVSDIPLEDLREEDLNNISVVALVDMIESQGFEVINDALLSNREELVKIAKYALRQSRNGQQEVTSAETAIIDASNQQPGSINNAIIDEEERPSLDKGNNNDDDSVHRDNRQQSQLQKSFDDQSMWELMKAQVKSDFAPFLLLVPKPVKVYIANQYRVYSRPVLNVIIGASLPMLTSAGHIFTSLGWALQHLGDTLLVFAKEHDFKRESDRKVEGSTSDNRISIRNKDGFIETSEQRNKIDSREGEINAEKDHDKVETVNIASDGADIESEGHLDADLMIEVDRDKMEYRNDGAAEDVDLLEEDTNFDFEDTDVINI